MIVSPQNGTRQGRARIHVVHCFIIGAVGTGSGKSEEARLDYGCRLIFRLVFLFCCCVVFLSKLVVLGH